MAKRTMTRNLNDFPLRYSSLINHNSWYSDILANQFDENSLWNNFATLGQTYESKWSKIDTLIAYLRKMNNCETRRRSQITAVINAHTCETLQL